MVDRFYSECYILCMRQSMIKIKEKGNIIKEKTSELRKSNNVDMISQQLQEGLNR